MRRGRSERRPLVPDAKYRSQLVAKFIGMVMVQGKRSSAERIVYEALAKLSEQNGAKDAVKALTTAVDHVRPLVEVKSRRVGGATYQVPIEVRQDRGTTVAMRWIRDLARARKGRPMEERLATELIDAFKGEGAAVRKRDETHKMAEANRAFSHYRW